MNKQKQTYLSPTTETLVVRFEGVICLSAPRWEAAIYATTKWAADDEDYGLE